MYLHSMCSLKAISARVSPRLTYRDLLRLNRSAVRLRIPSSPGYSLVAPETIVLNLNASADGYLPVTTSEAGYYAELARHVGLRLVGSARQKPSSVCGKSMPMSGHALSASGQLVHSAPGAE